MNRPSAISYSGQRMRSGCDFSKAGLPFWYIAP
jgi:hypothetical protein